METNDDQSRAHRVAIWEKTKERNWRELGESQFDIDLPFLTTKPSRVTKTSCLKGFQMFETILFECFFSSKRTSPLG